MPTVDEVEDYELRFRVEAEEHREEVEDNDDDDNTDDDADDDNGDAPQPDVAAQDGAIQGRCKICFHGKACMASLTYGHKLCK